MRTLVSLLTFLLLGTQTTTARADVGVIVTGDASLRAPLAAHVEAWLRDHNHALALGSLPATAVASIQACLARSDEACARQIVDQRVTAETFVLAHVEVTAAVDGTRNITLTGYWLRRGKDAIADRRYCERCTEQTLRQSAYDLMTALSASGQHATGHVSVTSSPSGATVLANGTPIGVTPLEYDLAPGNHVISITSAGHEIETRQIGIRDGETTRLGIPLVVSDRGSDRRGSRRLPIGLVVSGGALLVVGGALILADEDASPSSSAPLEIRNTGPLGVALAATGTAVVIVGAVLWARRGHDAGPVASASRNAGYIGWAGWF